MTSKTHASLPRRMELDCSARFYPIVATKRSQSLFNFAAATSLKTDGGLLAKAVKETLAFYPSIAVSMQKAYGRYVLVPNEAMPIVSECEDDGILHPIVPEKTGGYMFRFSYAEKRIEMDMFHALCDGTGAMQFFCDVLRAYGNLVNGEKSFAFNEASEEDTEDAFERYSEQMKFSDTGLKDIAGGVPLRFSGELNDNGRKLRDKMETDVAQLRAAAKKFGVTITAFICAVLAKSAHAVKRSDKPVVVMVPVNLRKLFPSATKRNFTTFVRIVIPRDKFTSDKELMREVQRQLTEKSDREPMQKFISTTARVQNCLPLRLAPLWLKIACTRLGRMFLKSRQTVIFSNIGVVEKPCEGIEDITFSLNVSENNPVNLGALSFGKKTCLSFTRMIKDRTFIKTFCNQLNAFGVQTDFV